MLEQMLAQFSYANFAYVVMSEMEPYLSKLFVELQAQQKEAALQDDKDQEGTDQCRGGGGGCRGEGDWNYDHGY